MPLSLRLALTYLIVTLASVFGLGAGLLLAADGFLAERRERELSDQAAIYAALLGEVAAAPADLAALAPATLGADLLPGGAAARIFTLGGGLVVGAPGLGPFPSRAALALLEPVVPLPASQVAGRRYVARLIPGAAGPLGVLELSRDAGPDARLIADLGRLTLRSALVAGLAVALISALVARSIARPISRLAARADALVAEIGGAPERARPGSRGEIAALSDSLAALDGALHSYLERIRRLEQARADFYRGVSHELRTPLTAVRAALENLADRAPPEGRPELARIEAEAARLGRLIDELLRSPDDGWLLLGERRPVDLAALAGEVLALLAGRARRAGVALELRGAAPLISGDPDRLRQALINLLDNALRLAHPGGLVVVELGAAAGLATLSVADNGPGVPAAQRELIWRRGYSGSPADESRSGLGLAIVAEIAAAHGGAARLDPGYGPPGARFIIELPV